MATSGISKDAASRFLGLIGLEVGGKPGRRAKNYSREYDLKAQGWSYAKVARQSLLENPDIREKLEATLRKKMEVPGPNGNAAAPTGANGVLHNEKPAAHAAAAASAAANRPAKPANGR